MLARDVEASLKLMDVPWLGLISNELVKDPKELKKQWAKLLKEAKFQDLPGRLQPGRQDPGGRRLGRRRHLVRRLGQVEPEPRIRSDQPQVLWSSRAGDNIAASG
jgi:hypothetical protein